MPFLPDKPILETTEEFDNFDKLLFSSDSKRQSNPTPKPADGDPNDIEISTTQTETRLKQLQRQLDKKTQAKQRELQRQLNLLQLQQIPHNKTKNQEGKEKQKEREPPTSMPTPTLTPIQSLQQASQQSHQQNQTEDFDIAQNTLISNYLGKKVLAELFGEEVSDEEGFSSRGLNWLLLGGSEEGEGKEAKEEERDNFGYEYEDYMHESEEETEESSSDDEWGDSRLCINPFKGHRVPPPPTENYRWGHIFHRISLLNEFTDEVRSSSRWG